MRLFAGPAQHLRHQQGRQHNAKTGTAVIQANHQATALRPDRAQARGEQPAGNEHQGAGTASQQALQQQRCRVGKKPTQAHKHTGQHRPQPKQA